MIVPIVVLCPPPGKEFTTIPPNPNQFVYTGSPFRDLMTNQNDWTSLRNNIGVLSYYDQILNVPSSEENPGILVDWIIDVNEACDDLQIDGFDGYFMDPNWAWWEYFDWDDVAYIDSALAANGLAFGYVFWAADCSNQEWNYDDYDWFCSTMEQGAECASNGITPDYYIYMSWLSIPEQIIPESPGTQRSTHSPTLRNSSSTPIYRYS